MSAGNYGNYNFLPLFDNFLQKLFKIGIFLKVVKIVQESVEKNIYDESSAITCKLLVITVNLYEISAYFR